MADATQSDNRLVEINDELNAILEDRITFLTTTVKTTERLTQQIASSELDIKRHTEMQSKLEVEMRGIAKELGALTETTENLSAERDGKQKDKYAKEKEIQRIEWEISDKTKAIENDDQSIRDLEKELDKLERENKKLKNRVKVLEEGVARMTKVKQEYMKQIQGLNQEMSTLTGPGDSPGAAEE